MCSYIYVQHIWLTYVCMVFKFRQCWTADAPDGSVCVENASANSNESLETRFSSRTVYVFSLRKRWTGPLYDDSPLVLHPTKQHVAITLCMLDGARTTEWRPPFTKRWSNTSNNATCSYIATCVLINNKRYSWNIGKILEKKKKETTKITK